MPQNIAPPGLISLLAAALAQQPTKPLVLALDGRCGSGKTTLANTLARQFPASITLHTDDFTCRLHSASALGENALRQYGPCPPAGRSPAPSLRGQPVQYRAYSCREGAYLPRGSWPRSRW